MIIGLLNQKGGVGKTTLSVSIAHQLVLEKPKSRVLVVDADPQQSSLTWSSVRDDVAPFSVVGLPKKTIHRDLQGLAEGYEHVVIDGPPRVTDLARSCILASDLVIIPCTPSPYDVWASAETVNLVREALDFKKNLKFFFAINRKIVNSAIGRDVKNALLDMEVDVFKSHISQRVLFAEAAASGKTVLDCDPRGKAASEIKKLVKEIKKTQKIG